MLPTIGLYRVPTSISIRWVRRPFDTIWTVSSSTTENTSSDFTLCKISSQYRTATCTPEIERHLACTVRTKRSQIDKGSVAEESAVLNLHILENSRTVEHTSTEKQPVTELYPLSTITMAKLISNGGCRLCLISWNCTKLNI